MTDPILEHKYTKLLLTEVKPLLDSGDIAAFKQYVAEMATHANKYRIHDLTAIIALQQIRYELFDRKMVESVQPEWGMAERKINAVHNEQQHRIRSQFWGEKHKNPYQ